MVLGIVVLFYLTDRPSQARWLTPEERQALEAELVREKAAALAERRDHLASVLAGDDATRAVLLLAAANFSIVCGHYGVEFFLPTIFERWYGFKLNTPGLGDAPALRGDDDRPDLHGSWNSDRTGERWWHTAGPMFVGSLAFLLTPLSRGSFPLSLLLLRGGPGRHPQLPGAVLTPCPSCSCAAPPPPAASA